MDQFLQCPACHRVIDDHDLNLDAIDEPAPCCGAKGEARAIWPGTAHHALDFVRKLDLDNHEERRVAIVFLASAIETLFDEMLWDVLRVSRTPRRAAVALMKKASGAHAKRELFTALVGEPIREVAIACGHGAWFDEWKRLVEARNGLAHGTWFSAKTRVADVPKVRDGALQAVAALHNAAIDSLDQPAMQ